MCSHGRKNHSSERTDKKNKPLSTIYRATLVPRTSCLLWTTENTERISSAYLYSESFSNRTIVDSINVMNSHSFPYCEKRRRKGCANSRKEIFWPFCHSIENVNCARVHIVGRNKTDCEL